MKNMSITCRSHVRVLSAGEVHWEEWSPSRNGGASQRPVVLVHGLSDSCRTWNRLAPALAAAGRRVVALDLPGHGHSARPDAPYTVAWYAGVVAEWIRSLGLDDFDLVGHSFGGSIAMCVAIERPGRIHRVGLVAAGGIGTEVALPLRVAAVTGLIELAAPVLMGVGTHAGVLVLGGEFNAEERRHLARVNARPGTARALSRTLRHAIDLRGQRHHLMDIAHRLPEIPPLAVYWGERDQVIPARHAADIDRYLEGVAVRRFAKAGHYPHREAVVDLAPDLLRFLDEPRAAARVRAGARAPRASSVAARAPQAGPRWQPWPDAAVRRWARSSLSPMLRQTPQQDAGDSASPADLGSRPPPVPC
ncbi:alpha/beta fold hydrolase [Sorangium sp. So ce375]|uniref:alpha/beta fold hydrolase n=1 Tax=Sorangium sp. So ce375 TaxID=3133306 RepID=UPI003F5C6F57